MKTIHQNILFFLVPLLAPLTASAETSRKAEPTNATSETTGSDTSWRASEVMGVDVENAAGETIGEVGDPVPDNKTSGVLAAIVSAGRFLGIADVLSAVPVTALRYDGTDKTLSTGLTKEQLGQAPQFKNDAWPDYNGASANEAPRSFRDPIDGDMSVPDTSAQNGRRLIRGAPTPINQGDRAGDARITRAIRSYIMDTNLSFIAKDVRITTRDEHVTLNGVVESAAEHQAVIMIARIHADTDKITDELEVNSK